MKHAPLAALVSVVIGLSLASCGANRPSPDDRADASADASGDVAVASTTRLTPSGFVRAGERFVARHASAPFSSAIDAHGATLADARGGSFGVHLARVGRAGAMRFVADATPSPRAERVELARDAAVTEWFASRPDGLEHGVDVEKRPAGEGELLLDVAIDGRTPHASADGSSIELSDPGGAAPLAYERLVVRDADGRALRASMSASSGAVQIHVDDRGARYPIAVDPLLFSKLLASLSSGQTGDGFGSSVDIHGSTVLVGAPQSYTVAGSGHAFVYAPTGGIASVLPNPSSTVAFGRSVATDGTWIAVGSASPSGGSGSIAVQAVASPDTLAATFSPTGSYPGFGAAIAMDAGTLFAAAGGTNDDVWFYAYSGGSWQTQHSYANAPASAVAISGTNAWAIGPSGNTYFTESGSTWTKIGNLPSSGGCTSAALDGALGALGCPKVGVLVYVYGSTTGWTKTATLLAGSSDIASVAVSASGGYVLAGSPVAGTVSVFQGSGSSWSLLNTIAAPSTSPAGFGRSLAIDGSTAVIGANSAPGTSTGAAYVYAAVLTNGGACTTASACQSGFCANGVCCDTACTSKCMACTAALKGSGADGTCGAIAKGTDPLAQCGANTCKTSTYAYTIDNGCNGAGACNAQGSGYCYPYVCANTTSCLTSCTADANCIAGDYCAAGVCTPRKADGASCSGADECTSGFCVDGVCCNTSCTANCMACSAALSGGTNGTCGYVVAGQPGRGECGAPTCASNTLTTPVCNGTGYCTTSTKSCGTYGCNATSNACATTCTTDADCGGSGFYCASGVCAAKHASGATCSASDQCTSGYCVDGVCCGSACSGPCEACDESGQAGSCIAVTGAPRTGHPACSGAGTACAGTCDGTNTAVCSYPNAGSTCGAGCTAGTVQLCSNTGACLAAAPCPGNYACTNATTCGASCTADAQCAPGFFCSGSTCVAALGNGATCTDAGQCSSGACVGGVCCASACSGGYACDATSGACKTSCSADADCVSTSYCQSGACVAKAANGAACTGGGSCASGNCYDGVCCDKPCGGNCQACVASKTGVAGSDGTCGFIPDGKDPDGDCGGGSCSGSTLTGNVCNGSGACRAISVDCGAASCVTSGTLASCATTCTTGADCAMTGFCKAGTCAPKLDRGNVCAANDDCKSGFCVDGVCCDSKCDGQCQACGEPGSVGTCVAVKGTPRAPRVDCAGSGTSCYGQCDGTDLSSCAYPSFETSCGTGCSDGKRAVCDGTGTCAAPAACAGNFACADAKSCKTSCVVDGDCEPGYLCSGGKCLPKASATCSADGLASIPTDADAGAAQSCVPYRCTSTGACGTECATSDDCAPGNQCDTSSKSCVGEAPATSTQTSGGCAIGGTSRAAASAWWAAIALGLVARARRRRAVAKASAPSEP